MRGSLGDDRLGQLLKEMEASLSHPLGPSGRIAELEAGRGFSRIPVGAHDPFSLLARDWHGDTVVTRDRFDIRLVLVTAKKPRHGAFTRLVENVIEAGLEPVVIAPVGPVMPLILQKWGWLRSVVPYGFGPECVEDQWRRP